MARAFAEIPPDLRSVLAKRRKARSLPLSRFFQPLKPDSGRVLVDPHHSLRWWIRPAAKETGSTCHTGGGASWLDPTDWSSFPQAVAEFHPGKHKPAKSGSCQSARGPFSTVGLTQAHRAGPPVTTTHMTQCQTQHNIPAIRETAGAAVHAAVTTTVTTKALAVVGVAKIAGPARIIHRIALRNSAPRGHVRHADPLRSN